MITSDHIPNLKRQARERAAAAANLTVEQARDRIAREHGFSTWAVLVRAVSSPLKKENA